MLYFGVAKRINPDEMKPRPHAGPAHGYVTAVVPEHVHCEEEAIAHAVLLRDTSWEGSPNVAR